MLLLKCVVCQLGHMLMVCKIFYQKFGFARVNKSVTPTNKFAASNTSGGSIKSEIMTNQQLAAKLNKTIIKNFVKSKVHSYFDNNIWGSDIQLISSRY